jgi:hypothetical protein
MKKFKDGKQDGRKLLKNLVLNACETHVLVPRLFRQLVIRGEIIIPQRKQIVSCTLSRL